MLINIFKKSYHWLKIKLLSSIFLKLFLGTLFIVISSGFIASQVSSYVYAQNRANQLEKKFKKINRLKNELIPLLQSNQTSEATELLLDHPKDSQQIFVYDEFDNEILSRYYSDENYSKFLFEHPISPNLYPDDFQENTIVNAFNGYSYLIQIKPLKQRHFFASSDLLGSILRLVFLLTISAIACYYFARTFTQKTQTIQKKIKRLTPSTNLDKSADPAIEHFDDLDMLSYNFDLMAKALDESNQLRRRMLSDISHEIRSPLARMQVALEIMRLHYPKAEKHINRIDKETIHIDHLINQIISIHKLQLAKLQLKKSFDLRLLINSIIQDVNYEYQNTNKHVELIEAPLVTLTADPEKMKIAFENIIRNAMSHTKEDSKVEVSLTINPNFTKICVKDFGEGVPEHQLSNIFEPFIRLDSSRNRSTGGYGLGLSITQQIIQQHKGSISASNHHNPSGLVMQVILPNQINQSMTTPSTNFDKINL